MSIVTKAAQTINAQVLRDETVISANTNDRVYQLLKDIIDSMVDYSQFVNGTATGVDTKVATIPGIESYSSSAIYFIRNVSANSGASTLNITGVGAKAIKADSLGTDVAASELPADSMLILFWNSANDWFQLVGSTTGGGGGVTYFLGIYASLVALQTAYPTASPGEYAYVDGGIGTDIVMYIWDDDDADWILSAGGTPSDWTVALVNGATSKPTPVDADEMGILDSAAAFILKKLTWANLKATLKTYFDTLYSSGGAVALDPAPFDGMGAVVLVGTKRYIRAKFAGTLTGWSIIADGSSPTLELYIKKIASGTALPSASIVASDPPDLTTGNAVKSTSMTGWTTSFAADDIFEVGITSATVTTRFEFTLYASN